MKKHQPAAKNGQKRQKKQKKTKNAFFFVKHPTPYPLSSGLGLHPLQQFKHVMEGGVPTAPLPHAECTGSGHRPPPPPFISNPLRPSTKTGQNKGAYKRCTQADRGLGMEGGGGTRPWFWFVCPWRCPLASSHCRLRPSVGPNVFWSCQRSPWMTCPALRGRLSQRQAVARAFDQVHPDAHSEPMLGLPTPALTCAPVCASGGFS